MLTTKDNPFDPYTEYQQWMQWDEQHGYFTQQYLARIADIPDDEEDDVVIEQLTQDAMEDIVNNGPLGMHIIV